MDSTEIVVKKYLRHIGYSDIIYEPDGNIPPDFLIDGRIAVEVRRLNEHYSSSDGRVEGLEIEAMRLHRQISELFKEFGPGPADGPSWIATVLFLRPLPKWRVVRPKMKKWISSIVENQVFGEFSEMFEYNITLVLNRIDVKGEGLVWIGGYLDEDSGGWLISLAKRNITICIDEKNRKIARHRSKYSEWWLILVDYVTYSMSQDNRDKFLESTKIKHDWSRIVVVNPLDHTSNFDITSCRQ